MKEGIGALGRPTNSGFHSWKNDYALTDAPLVAQIKAAGGIILGKASLSEFTNSGGDNINSVRPGFCRHPDSTARALASPPKAFAISTRLSSVLLARSTLPSVPLKNHHTPNQTNKARRLDGKPAKQSRSRDPTQSTVAASPWPHSAAFGAPAPAFSTQGTVAPAHGRTSQHIMRTAATHRGNRPREKRPPRKIIPLKISQNK